jgi:hypothetical protein
LPILNSHFNARSTDGGAALGARGSHDGCNEGKSEKEKHTPQSGSDIPMEDYTTAFPNVGVRESDTQQEEARRSSDNAIGDDAPEGLAARGDWENLVKILNNRELGSKRDMQPRGLLTSILAWGLHAFMSLPIRIRGLTPDGLVGRDAVDDILDVYMSNMNHATREPLPQQETQARGIPDGPKTVARDGSAANDFINALLHSRDSSGELTLDHVLSLASLASRALDELD